MSKAPNMTELTREIATHLDGWTARSVRSLMRPRRLLGISSGASSPPTCPCTLGRSESVTQRSSTATS